MNPDFAKKLESLPPEDAEIFRNIGSVANSLLREWLEGVEYELTARIERMHGLCVVHHDGTKEYLRRGVVILKVPLPEFEI
jgi:hypothetical protein